MKPPIHLSGYFIKKSVKNLFYCLTLQLTREALFGVEVAGQSGRDSEVNSTQLFPVSKNVVIMIL